MSSSALSGRLRSVGWRFGFALIVLAAIAFVGASVQPAHASTDHPQANSFTVTVALACSGTQATSMTATATNNGVATDYYYVNPMKGSSGATQPVLANGATSQPVTLDVTKMGFDGSAKSFWLRAETTYSGDGGTQYPVSLWQDRAVPNTCLNSTPPVNHAPVAQNGSVTTEAGKNITFQVKATDQDGDTLSYQLVGPPNHGAARLQGSTVRYAPSAGFSGTDEVHFRASDGKLESNTATVNITVKAPAPTSQTVHVKQSSLGQGCGEDQTTCGAHFVITQIGQAAPASIQVALSDGSTQTVGLDKVSGKTAHYTVKFDAGTTVTDATATLPSDWSGQFNLSHYLCQESTPAPQLVTPTAPTHTTPTCDKPDETVTPSNQPGVVWSPSGSTTLKPGESVTYHATPAEGWTFPKDAQTEWSSTNGFDSSRCGGDTYPGGYPHGWAKVDLCTSPVTDAPWSYTLRPADDRTAGTVDGTVDKWVVVFADGSQQRVSPNTNGDYVFETSSVPVKVTGIRLDKGVAKGTEVTVEVVNQPSCETTPPPEHHKHVVTPAAPTATTPTCDNPDVKVTPQMQKGVVWQPAGSTTLKSGQTVTYTASPAKGWKFAKGARSVWPFANDFVVKDCSVAPPTKGHHHPKGHHPKGTHHQPAQHQKQHQSQHTTVKVNVHQKVQVTQKVTSKAKAAKPVLISTDYVDSRQSAGASLAGMSAPVAIIIGTILGLCLGIFRRRYNH